MERQRSQCSSSSDDEEDDGEALISQNEVKAPLPRRVASFEIGRLPRPDRPRPRSGRKYLLAACVPLLLILVFFSVDVGSLFRGVSPVRFVPPVGEEDHRARERELRALYLLRNQQLGLLRLWNRTSADARPRSGGVASVPSPVPPMSSSISTPNASQTASRSQAAPSPPPPSVSIEEFRSALLEQIKLNQQIQKALLSTHRPVAGNATAEEAGDNVGDLLSGSGGVDVCRKVEKPADRRTIEWKPKKDRFLYAICVSGQMSNHLICLQKHMFFAALLGRVLIIPSPKFDYHYDRVIDVDHINKCVGRKVVISFEEFSEKMKNKVHISKFICYTASPPCFVDEEHSKRLKALGLSLPKLEAAWPEDAKLSQPKRRTADDIMSKFSCDDEVLAIGDMFYADVEEEWVMQPGGPIAHKCETLIKPSRLIVLTAQRFVQTFLGSNYIALHFRRHGFLKFCNAKEESCFFPIPQAAECILRVVERADAPVIYLSTDAANSETNLLQSLVVLNDKTIPLIKRPEHTSVEKWDALLYRSHLGGDNQVEAMLDKTICAMSNVFIGSSGSTFTDDIFRLRRHSGYASVCDENLCRGEKPNFIAEKE